MSRSSRADSAKHTQTQTDTHTQYNYWSISVISDVHCLNGFCPSSPTDDGLHGLTGGVEGQGVGVHARGDAGSRGSERGGAWRGGGQTGRDAGGQTQGAPHGQEHQQVLRGEREVGGEGVTI